ncbi:2-oxoglutarate dehydrogenase E1 subunit family protein, partial [Mycolicibacter terrae]
MSGVSSPFGQNEWLVEEMYRKFRDDPSSVDPSWHDFLVDYKPGGSASLDGGSPSPTPAPPPAAPTPPA